GDGVSISGGASNNTVGGTVAAARNIISGNENGVNIYGDGTAGNLVRGNYIGLNVAGTMGIANNYGVQISNGATHTRVGGSAAGAGNVISGNASTGVYIQDFGTSGNAVRGNLIGLNAAGTAAVPNHYGVWIFGSPNNTVGGTVAGARN